MVYESIVDLTNQITGNSKKHTGILIDVIAGMMIYLLLANLLPLIPGLTDIQVNNVALFRQPTADFSTTLGLSLAAVIAIQFVSIKEWGILGHIGKYLPLKKVYLGFKKGIGSGFMTLIDVFVGLLDILGEFAKIISLSLRLFGNMYAGAVLMMIIFGAIAWGLPAVWLGMNIFTGVLQAMVFAVLVGAYYMLVIKNPEESDE
jgi:F-type H+-transporting ATPase subunit a